MCAEVQVQCPFTGTVQASFLSGWKRQRRRKAIMSRVALREPQTQASHCNNPLAWWKENHHRFPVLAEMARIYLAVQPPSAPAECVFGCASQLLSLKNSAWTFKIMLLLTLPQSPLLSHCIQTDSQFRHVADSFLVQLATPHELLDSVCPLQTTHHPNPLVRSLLPF